MIYLITTLCLSWTTNKVTLFYEYPTLGLPPPWSPFESITTPCNNIFTCPHEENIAYPTTYPLALHLSYIYVSIRQQILCRKCIHSVTFQRYTTLSIFANNNNCTITTPKLLWVNMHYNHSIHVNQTSIVHITTYDNNEHIQLKHNQNILPITMACLLYTQPCVSIYAYIRYVNVSGHNLCYANGLPIIVVAILKDNWHGIIPLHLDGRQAKKRKYFHTYIALKHPQFHQHSPTQTRFWTLINIRKDGQLLTLYSWTPMWANWDFFLWVSDLLPLFPCLACCS